jgi:hypothetical protein
MAFYTDVKLGLSHSRGNTKVESVDIKVLKEVLRLMRQEVAGDCN